MARDSIVMLFIILVHFVFQCSSQMGCTAARHEKVTLKHFFFLLVTCSVEYYIKWQIDDQCLGLDLWMGG